tara:strand:- start:4936 stop:5460 length:525 start_codon:yes stop_codon:yes gene_type:complete
MYFSLFPKGYYDLKGDGNPKIVTDLMRRVKVRAKIKDEASLYDSYDVVDGDTPESIAFKFYGNSELHWVILMLNNVTDRYYGWPLTTFEFEKMMKEKYENADGIHHYEKVQSSGPQTSPDYSHLIECKSTDVGAMIVSNREYEDREQFKKRQIKLLSPGVVPALLEEFQSLISQ